MQQVRFGIIGVGNMGSGHLNHILNGNVPELKVTAVADLNPQRLQAALEAAQKANQPIETFSTATALFESRLCGCSPAWAVNSWPYAPLSPGAGRKRITRRAAGAVR